MQRTFYSIFNRVIGEMEVLGKSGTT